MVKQKTFYMDGIIVDDGKDTELCDAAILGVGDLGLCVCSWFVVVEAGIRRHGGFPRKINSISGDIIGEQLLQNAVTTVYSWLCTKL